MDLFLQSLNEAAQSWPEDSQRGAGWRRIPENGVAQIRDALSSMEERLAEAGVNRSTHSAFWTAFRSFKTQVSKHRSIKLETLSAVIERLPAENAGLALLVASSPDGGEKADPAKLAELDTSSLTGFCTSLLAISEAWESDTERQGEGWRVIPADMLQPVQEAFERFKGIFELQAKMKAEPKFKNRFGKMEQSLKSGAINTHMVEKLLKILGVSWKVLS